MARLTAEQDALRKCVEELDLLERQVDARLTPQGTSTKQIPFEFSESFIFESGDMRVQKRSFKNGAEDLYFSEPSFAVVYSANEAQGPTGNAAFDLLSTEAGFRAPLLLPTPGGDEPILRAPVLFDFYWNWVIGSQAENYANPAQDVSWMSRKSLSNRDRWLPLAFRYPLRLKGGDSITFSVKPAINGFITADYRIVVNMTMTGRRNGRMAESAFDPEFRRSNVPPNPVLAAAMRRGR